MDTERAPIALLVDSNQRARVLDGGRRLFAESLARLAGACASGRTWRRRLGFRNGLKNPIGILALALPVAIAFFSGRQAGGGPTR